MGEPLHNHRIAVIHLTGDGIGKGTEQTHGQRNSFS
jgi:hypothetical protein